MSAEAKAILDKWAVVVATKEAVFLKDGEPQVNQDLNKHYKPEMYSEDICLWIPPNDCIRLEFEDKPENNLKYVNQAESNCKSLGIQCCTTYHEGGKSPYLNIFNLKGIPLDEDNKAAKFLLIDLLLSEEGKTHLDRTNLGWHFSPVIGHPHWKPKYRGAVHKVVAGIPPLEQKNEYPKELKKELNKSKKKNKSYIIDLKKTAKWAEDFLLNYCCNNLLPTGERHIVVEKNLCALVAHRSDRESIVSQYCRVQNQPVNSVYGWLPAILRGDYNQVSAGELKKYIQRNSIPFQVPEWQPEKEEAELIFNKDKFRLKVLDILAVDNANATEMLATTFEKITKTYTTRHDESPEVWTYDKQKGIFCNAGQSRIQEFCRDILGEFYTAYLSNTVINKIMADTYVEADWFFNQKYLDEICVANGILNLKTKELTDFTPDKIFFSRVEWYYQPDKDCPAIKKFLSEIQKHQEDSKIIQEMFGYSLLDAYPIEKAIMLNGSGRNGKSKMLELMRRFIGPENCTNISLEDLEKDGYAQAELFKKKLNLAADISNSYIKDVGKFKSLTGQDMISANRKFLTHVRFTNTAKMIFSCNELPKVADKSFGFWNRMILIDFPYTFLSQEELDLAMADPKLESSKKAYLRLKNTHIIDDISKPEEMSGLLNWALEGLQRLQSQGDFSYSATTEEVQKMWTRKSDSFKAFVDDIIDFQPETKIKKSELQKAYFDYCKKHQIDKREGNKHIKFVLDGLGVEEDRQYDGTEKESFWLGITTKNIPVDESYAKDDENRQAGQGGQGFQTHIGGDDLSIRFKMPVLPVLPVQNSPEKEKLVTNGGKPVCESVACPLKWESLEVAHFPCKTCGNRNSRFFKGGYICEACYYCETEPETK